MSQLFSGSVCLTDLLEKAKEKHSAFVKAGSNNKIYANLLLWLNDEPDKYGNNGSIQLNSTKDMKEKEEKIYVGNFRAIERKAPEPLGAKEIQNLPDASTLVDDLPF